MICSISYGFLKVLQFLDAVYGEPCMIVYGPCMDHAWSIHGPYMVQTLSYIYIYHSCLFYIYVLSFQFYFKFHFIRYHFHSRLHSYLVLSMIHFLHHYILDFLYSYPYFNSCSFLFSFQCYL